MNRFRTANAVLIADRSVRRRPFSCRAAKNLILTVMLTQVSCATATRNTWGEPESVEDWLRTSREVESSTSLISAHFTPDTVVVSLVREDGILETTTRASHMRQERRASLGWWSIFVAEAGLAICAGLAGSDIGGVGSSLGVAQGDLLRVSGIGGALAVADVIAYFSQDKSKVGLVEEAYYSHNRAVARAPIPNGKVEIRAQGFRLEAESDKFGRVQIPLKELGSAEYLPNAPWLQISSDMSTISTTLALDGAFAVAWLRLKGSVPVASSWLSVNEKSAVQGEVADLRRELIAAALATLRAAADKEQVLEARAAMANCDCTDRVFGSECEKMRVMFVAQEEKAALAKASEEARLKTVQAAEAAASAEVFLRSKDLAKARANVTICLRLDPDHAKCAQLLGEVERAEAATQAQADREQRVRDREQAAADAEEEREQERIARQQAALAYKDAQRSLRLLLRTGVTKALLLSTAQQVKACLQYDAEHRGCLKIKRQLEGVMRNGARMCIRQQNIEVALDLMSLETALGSDMNLDTMFFQELIQPAMSRSVCVTAQQVNMDCAEFTCTMKCAEARGYVGSCDRYAKTPRGYDVVALGLCAKAWSDCRSLCWPFMGRRR